MNDLEFERIKDCNSDLNNLIKVIQEQNLSFNNLSKDLLVDVITRSFESDLIKIYDLRHIRDNWIDLETDKFIITFSRLIKKEGIIQSSFKICNDLLLCTSAEVEIESGYMDECTIKYNDKFYFTKGIEE